MRQRPFADPGTKTRRTLELPDPFASASGTRSRKPGRGDASPGRPDLGQCPPCFSAKRSFFWAGFSSPCCAVCRPCGIGLHSKSVLDFRCEPYLDKSARLHRGRHGYPPNSGLGSASLLAFRPRNGWGLRRAPGLLRIGSIRTFNRLDWSSSTQSLQKATLESSPYAACDAFMSHISPNRPFYFARRSKATRD